MKFLSSPMVQAWLLIFILSFYGWPLWKEAAKLQRKRPQLTARDLVLGNDQLSGIDVFGKHLDPAAPTVKNNVVFVVRNGHIQDDLNFWNHVAVLLRPHKEIRLLAYCDSQQCVEAIRATRPVAFPVLASGEAISIQAIVDADSNGDAIITRVGTSRTTKIAWRTSESKPETIAEKITR